MTRRGVIGAIGGTAVVGVTSVLGVAQEGDVDGGPSPDDYWRVTEASAATTVTEDTDEAVRSDGDVYVGRGVTLDAPIQADGHVLVGPGAVIRGSIEADGAVVVDRIVDVDGGVFATDDVVLGVDVERAREDYDAGDLQWVTDLPMEGGLVVGDDVRSARHVFVGPDSVLEGDVEAIQVDGVSGGGEGVDPPSVLLGSWVDVVGDVSAAGHAVLGPDTVVDGTVTAGGNALFGEGVSFGDIEAERIDEGAVADLWPRDDEGNISIDEIGEGGNGTDVGTDTTDGGGNETAGE